MAQLLAVLYFSNCVHCVCVSVHMSVSALKRLEAWDPLEPKWQVLVGCLTWVFGIEFRSSARAESHFLKTDYDMVFLRGL